ncbi:hypothetical protein G7Z17_g4429 [Cylindrodendrum hubeiense]|uniref:Uncharacterized protein n=1 Tax=Cylindrodendrum hubeiense TaxID=595255 RepID=A0A9P5LIB3_9HYPO|nr:hypothetical protein G7Z17_g4429 [Cylindrodendrum hubeiense]
MTATQLLTEYYDARVSKWPAHGDVIGMSTRKCGLKSDSLSSGRGWHRGVGHARSGTTCKQLTEPGFQMADSEESSSPRVWAAALAVGLEEAVGRCRFPRPGRPRRISGMRTGGLGAGRLSARPGRHQFQRVEPAEWRVRGAATPAKAAKLSIPRPTPAALAGDMCPKAPQSAPGRTCLHQHLISHRTSTVIDQETARMLDSPWHLPQTPVGPVERW